MPVGVRHLVKSSSNERLIASIATLISSHSEALLIAPSRSAGEQVAHRIRGIAGLHRMTLIQVANDLVEEGREIQAHLEPLAGRCADERTTAVSHW